MSKSASSSINSRNQQHDAISSTFKNPNVLVARDKGTLGTPFECQLITIVRSSFFKGTCLKHLCPKNIVGIAEVYLVNNLFL